MIKRLDVAIRQVLIESRIVIATNDFTKELGCKVWRIFSANHTRSGALNQQHYFWLIECNRSNQ
ncbi:MAG: hypothetical protein Q9N32_01190 [Gammaproteobacteria bacterium]|nr:hypothetical protein [Gammaproteobacteria bacterium]